MPQNLVMEKPDSSLIKQALCWLLVILACLSARAQKLPNKQTAGQLAPSNIKIDGKATEWNNTFHAYNNATQIYYTIANDKQCLYLIVQASDPLIISRILDRGVTFTIAGQPDKSTDETVSVTYPEVENSPYFGLTNKKRMAEITTPKAADSLMARNNELLDRSCKQIRVKGVPGIDSLISVYNTDGIKAAGAFDVKRAYTFEVAIDLALLKNVLKGSDKFAYHVRINGSKPMGMASVLSATPGNEAIMEAFVSKANELSARQSAPTDFGGEYTLVK